MTVVARNEAKTVRKRKQSWNMQSQAMQGGLKVDAKTRATGRERESREEMWL